MNPWTETLPHPRDRDPLDRDPLDRELPLQRPSPKTNPRTENPAKPCEQNDKTGLKTLQQISIYNNLEILKKNLC